jgi:hypothetical protein
MSVSIPTFELQSELAMHKIIIHQMKCTGLNHKHLKENKSEQSVWQETHAMNSGVWCTRFNIKKGVPHFPFLQKLLMHVLHAMFSQLFDLLLLLTLLILKHLISHKWFFFFLPFLSNVECKGFLFQFFDGANQSGNHPHKTNSSNLATGHRGKQENSRISLYFGKSVGTYCLNMAISEVFFPQISQVFSQKAFV